MCHTIKPYDPKYKYIKSKNSDLIIGIKTFNYTNNFLSSLFLTHNYYSAIKTINEYGIVISDSPKEQDINYKIPYTCNGNIDRYNQRIAIFKNVSAGMHVSPVIEIIRKVLAGMHIEPVYNLIGIHDYPTGDTLVLIDANLLGKKDILEKEKVTELYRNINERITIPVAFYVSDIIFYDGVDVSVNEFIIPDFNFMKEIIIDEICYEDRLLNYVRNYKIIRIVSKESDEIINISLQIVSPEEWLEEYKKFYNYLIKKAEKIINEVEKV